MLLLKLMAHKASTQIGSLPSLLVPNFIQKFQSLPSLQTHTIDSPAGNIYSRIMNPTTHVLESRVAQLEGGHPLAGLAVASGTSACFFSIINLAQFGDNIVSSNKLYGGTYTQFNMILPSFGGASG